jgi:type I restriction-modification system DNA methylase subunit
MNELQREITKLAKLNVDKHVRKASGACEENVKIKIVIPLLNLLDYDTKEDMDFEHHVQNKKADIALLLDNKPKLLVEAKDLDEQLDNHVNQGLDYAFNKGIEWVILTNGLEIRIYKSFIPGISNPKDRLLYKTTLKNLPQSFTILSELIGKQHLRKATRLSERAESVKESITEQVLIADLAECRERLFKDLLGQFKSRYRRDIRFKELIDAWATLVQMDISDPEMIDKLCKEGAYTLINRVLFLRVCEDRGYVKPKLSKDAIAKWREMVEEPSNLLNIAFKEISKGFEALYKSPLFDSINFEDIEWSKNTINFVLDKLGEQDFSNISKDILGKAYEQHISREERKELGQFYTPDFVIDYILDRVPISPDKTILDPACGSGGFLIRAYDRLRRQYLDEGWAEELIHHQILNKNIFGIDINPFATQLTVMNLYLKDLTHPTGEVNIVEGDTLEKLEEKFDLKIYEVKNPLSYVTKTDKKLTYALLLQNRPFDIVISNPPYISFGTRGTLHANEVKKGYFEFLKKNYPNSAEYKLSIYSIFLDRGIELLKDSGTLGFIVPDSFLLGKYYFKIRRRILDSCAIQEICLFQKDFWKQGIVGLPVIIILRKERDKEKRLKNAIEVRQCSFDKNEYVFKTYRYNQEYFEHNVLNRFRLMFSKQDMDFVRNMEQDSKSLSDFVTIHTGIRPKNNRKGVIGNSKLGEKWQRGLVSSNEVGRYALHYAGSFLNINPKLLWSGGWNPMVVHAPKILLRRTGDSLIACYDDQSFYHLDNIHSIVSKGSIKQLKYILAIINSRIMNRYYKLISLESGRVMAQLDIETIELLPIKQASEQQQSKIANLVDELIGLNKALSKTSSEIDIASISAKVEGIDGELEEQVCLLYGISYASRKTIRR